MKKAFKSDNAPAPAARYSQAIKAGNTLYLQGMIALDPATGKLTGNDIVSQTNRVFKSITSVLSEAGMNVASVIKATVFLADLADYPEFNKIYNSYFTMDPPPVRTTVQAKLPFNALVEVDCIAWQE